MVVWKTYFLGGEGTVIGGGRAEGEVNWVRLNPAFASRRAAGFSGKGERVSGRALPREVRVERERERERERIKVKRLWTLGAKDPNVLLVIPVLVFP